MTDKPYRSHGTGSLTQRHTAECPPPVAGVRPEHRCTGPWVGTFEAGWTTKGTRARRSVVAPTKPEAQRRLIAAIRASEQVAPVVGAKPTVHSWAETWLTTTQTELRATTWATNRSAVRQWIDPTIGRKRLEALTPGDIRAVTRAATDAGREPATASRAHVVLQWMLKDAVREGWSVPPAAFLVTGPSLGEVDRDAIPLPDAVAILDAAAKRPDASRWVAALLQGMRPAECLGLTWRAIDFDAETIDISWQLKPLPYQRVRDRSSGFVIPTAATVRHLDGALHLIRPKTTAGRRIIPLIPWMASSLRTWRDLAPHSPHDLVWPRGDGRPQSDVEDRALWVGLQDVAQVAAVDGTTGRRYALYEARHTTATLLREAGRDDDTITAIMGHASILSTKAYLHTSNAKTSQALADVANSLGLTAG